MSATGGLDRAGAGSRDRSDFSALVTAVRAAGLLERRRVGYMVRTSLTLVFLGLVVLAVIAIGDSWFQLLAAVALAIAFAQVAFLGHDAGHQAIFAIRRNNDAFGRVLGNVVIGLSYGWWIQTHNRHHANPNHEDRDPDIGDGVLAFTTAQARKRRGALSRFVVRRQAWLFFPLTLLEGISLHVDSIISVVTGRDRSARGGRRRIEALTLVLHAALLVTLVLSAMSPAKAVAFLAVNQAAWGLYMSCTFAPAHKGMPIISADMQLDFLRRQVLTSRDVRGSRFIDLALGGLNYQIEHHLFPSMPRSNLRSAQGMIRAHCASVGISFQETTLWQSYRAVLQHLDAIGAPLRDEMLTPTSARS
ncbi:MAG: fatty acid desaturase family protein [Jatrophihabitans sp.]|uniref:fatty acid desaturase family protein n=1 Tax=Jatrophihabitans sp. TaxID=1932789 RepID=UPI003F802274